MRCGPGTIKIEFDVTNPEAVRWAESRAARLVTNISNESRQAIRTMVTEGFTQHIPVKDTARIIRSSIGLTERDALAVVKAQKKWLDSGIGSVRAIAKAERYAAKLLRSRSLTIARTETMTASNQGQQELWNQAQDAGLLTGREQKVWITADPCPICAGLEGETVGINDSFSIGSDPPAHPNCKCTTGLVL